MNTTERIADSLILSTVGMGCFARCLLKDQPAGKRGGISKTKVSRKAARSARRTTRRG